MKKYFLGIIIGLGLLLRLIGLGIAPNGLTPDEASFGYDAYSIIKTGKDQWGKNLPLVFESFGDYKSPLYGYLTIPFVFTLGLNSVAVRLPNALLGIASIYVVYLLVKKISGKESTALIASLLVSLSPWHIPLSRGAFEANLTTFFLPLGILLSLNKKYFLSALIFGLNLFSYHSAKLVTPLIVLFLVIFLRKINWKFIIVFSIFVLLTAHTFFLGAGRRAQDVSIFNGSLLEAAEKRIAWINNGADPYIAHAVYNKYTISISRFTKNYTSYFSPRFLFLKGPGEYTYGMVKGVGVINLIEIITLAAFIVSLFKKKDSNYWLIFFWIIISPIPAALSQGVGFAGNRVAVMMPAIQIASSLGLLFLLAKYSKKEKVINTIFVALILLGLTNFLVKYLKVNRNEMAKSMLNGNISAMNYLKDNYKDENIFVSTGLSEPHIYWAFVNKIDPKTYQESTKNWGYKDKDLKFLDQLNGYKLDKVIFGRIDLKTINSFKGIIVGRPDEFKGLFVPEKIIYYPDGKEAVYVINNGVTKYAKVY